MLTNTRPPQLESTLDPSQVPLAQCNVFECECGCMDFELLPRVKILYNRLKPTQCGLAQQVQLKCTQCSAIMDFGPDGARRINAHHQRQTFTVVKKPNNPE